MTVASFDEITASKPEKSLTERLKKNGGRNQQGRLTVRHQGGGHKRLYRLQAHEGRYPGSRRYDRVRSEPQRPHRSAQLR